MRTALARSIRQFLGLAWVFVVFGSTMEFCYAVEGSVPQWIWYPTQMVGPVPAGACFFRRTFDIDSVQSGTLEVAADDAFEVYVNGKVIGRGSEWRHFTKYDISGQLQRGTNVVAIKVVNRESGTAGLVGQITIAEPATGVRTFVTDKTWKSSLQGAPMWSRPHFAERHWKSSQVWGPWGETPPWIPPVQDIPILAGQSIPIDGGAVPSPSVSQPVRWESVDDTDELFQQVAAKDSIRRTPRRTPHSTSTPLLKRLTKPLENGLDRISGRSKRENSAEANGFNTPTTAASAPLAETTTPAGIPRTALRDPLFQNNVANDTGNESTTVPAAGEAGSETEQNATETTEDLAKRFQPRPGFHVEHVVARARTGSLIAMTFNEFGQVLASQEQGPIVLLLDTNQDGQLDSTRVYADQVKNCHGLLALSGMVFAVGEGPQGSGLYRLRDVNRDGMIDETKLLVGFEVAVGEHGPHGIVLGPEGSLYIAVGNHAKIKGTFDESSPQKYLYEGDLVPRFEDPGGHAHGIRAPGGFILRTDVEGRRKELYASGLRNAYDLAFNEHGQLFTYDSDMESDVGTTWYRPTRLYHVLPSAEFGWRSGWATWPDHFHDSVPPVAETGRGSPTGMVFYQHYTYPSEYWNAAFLGDWSEGRIWVAKLEERGSTYRGQPEVFLTGSPLNITDLDVGPDGAIYFCTGGRATQGGVYRIVADTRPPAVEPSGIQAALQAPQQQGSWGRQRLATAHRELGAAWSPQIRAAALDSKLPARRRIQALQAMQWVGPIPDAGLLKTLAADADPRLRQMAALFMGTSADVELGGTLRELLVDRHPVVRRQACESLVRRNQTVPFAELEPILRSTDVAEAWAGRRLLAVSNPTAWMDDALQSDDIRTFIQASTTLMVAHPSKERALKVAERAQVFLDGFIADPDFVELLRVLELVAVRGGVQPAEVVELTNNLAEEFPAANALMNRELIRLLVHWQVTSIVDRYLDHLGSDISPEDRIHLVTHLHFLKVNWTGEQRLRLFQHIQAPSNAGSSVAGYLQNVAKDLAEHLSPADDAFVLEHGANYPSAALAAVLRLPEKLTDAQVSQLIQLDRQVTGDDDVARRLKVAIIAMLAREGRPESMQYLRECFDTQPLRRRELAIGLSAQPTPEDFDYLVGSLNLLDAAETKEILVQLKKISKSPAEAEPYRQVIMAGRRLRDAGGDDAVRLLEHWRGFAPSEKTPPWEKALQVWHRWYVETFPDALLPESLTPTTHQRWDYDQLLKHLTPTTIAAGSASIGADVFVKAQCASCHRHGSRGESMGPELSTVGKRFLTKEILDSVLFPSRVISDQYQGKTVVTTDGSAISGLVGAGSPDEIVVLQVDGKKHRIPRSEIESMTPSKVSAMPEGLLDRLTLDEITHLMTFLLTSPVDTVTRRP